ncbi:unnamed protein product [Lasius platythorax]|uniref:Uncharacterized protein n=1 Tax=Lasius platythorax TaxID=488582 RepID=A0AAV2P7N1_9HYME
MGIWRRTAPVHHIVSCARGSMMPTIWQGLPNIKRIKQRLRECRNDSPAPNEYELLSSSTRFVASDNTG